MKNDSTPVSEHDKKIAAVRQALDDLYSDTSVSRARTKADLYELREEINTDIWALIDDEDSE